MRSVILCGPSRSGKSTLARRLHAALGHSPIHIDKLVAAFGAAYPQLDVRLNWDRQRTGENLAPFLGHYLGALSTREGGGRADPFVLEGAYFHFDAILPILGAYGITDWREHFLLIGLVQNRKTADEFFRDFRRYDTEDDWTHGMTGDDLRDIAEEAVAYSRAMTAYMTRFGFTLYDTSQAREQVMARIVEDVRRDG